MIGRQQQVREEAHEFSLFDPSEAGGSSRFYRAQDCLLPVRDNYNLKSRKYVCITTYQRDTASNPNANPNPNPTGKQQAIVNIQLNMVICTAYPDKFMRDMFGTVCTTLSCNCHTAVCSLHNCMFVHALSSLNTLRLY